jgi:penicillin-insensitive murein DD-endopeptidase
VDTKGAVLCFAGALTCTAAASQELPWLKASPAPALHMSAKDLFGSVTTPAPLPARAIGSYARGCLSGGVALPVNGPGWQVMRLSRSRNWGHPTLIAYLERLSADARSMGWPGLLIGDLAQPRGGPMLTGHTSHQIGLDADIWLTPMPNRQLTAKEREEFTAQSMLRDAFNVDQRLWTPWHTRLIKLAASYARVERIFVHPAIKQKLCDQAGGDRAWLSKVRPWWGHHYHFHVRIACPRADSGCRPQAAVVGGDGCGVELGEWFERLRQADTPSTTKPTHGNASPTLKELPAECRQVIAWGGAAARRPRDLASDKPAGPPPPSARQRPNAKTSAGINWEPWR